MRKSTFTILFFLLLFSTLTAQQLPEYEGPINDLAGILKPSEMRQLKTKVIAYRNQTGNEIGVLIIPTLENHSLEDYAHDVLEEWGIGQEGKDNGVFFLIAIEEKKARVEVGYGLEADLTDNECGKLVKKNSPMADHFRKGDFAGGINAVLDGIIQGINGVYEPPRPKKHELGKLLFLIIVVTIIILLVKIVTPKRSGRKRFGGPFDDGFFGGGGLSSGGFGGGSSSSGGGGGFGFGGGSSGGGGASGGW